MGALYAEPTCPFGRPVVVITGGSVEIARLNGFETACPRASVTWKPIEDEPACVGVPARVPSLARARPGGKLPELNDQM
jgi:hypothetical protein